jgi:protein SCO1/2/putative membrane protein
VNAALNSLATVLLITGWVHVRRGRVIAHKRIMLSAFGVSILFLACYLLYHFALHQYTGSSSRKFAGTGPIRSVYLAILGSHVVLAAVVPILAIVTIRRGLRADWPRHRRIARITFPIWLYVSVTGVIIYGMLYHWN